MPWQIARCHVGMNAADLTGRDDLVNQPLTIQIARHMDHHAVRQFDPHAAAMVCCHGLLPCSAEERDSSKNLAGQSAQTETFGSLNLMPELPIFASIGDAEDLVAPSAVSSTDKMRRPKRPPLRSTRPPSARPRLPRHSLTPNLLPFAHNLPHQKKPRDRNSPAPRLPTLARMVSPDAYTSRPFCGYCFGRLGILVRVLAKERCPDARFLGCGSLHFDNVSGSCDGRGCPS